MKKEGYEATLSSPDRVKLNKSKLVWTEGKRSDLPYADEKHRKEEKHSVKDVEECVEMKRLCFAKQNEVMEKYGSGREEEHSEETLYLHIWEKTIVHQEER